MNITKRQIIKIDDEKCNGCGICIPNCPEGALQIIDGKARLVSDLFCDGLGACIGHCPEDAITTEVRHAEPYDEKKVMENIVKQGENTIKAHLQHLKEHNATEYYDTAIEYLKENDIEVPDIEKKESLACGCPGSMLQKIKREKSTTKKSNHSSELAQWPVQLNLLPPQAPFFNGSDLLIAADCVPFAYANFHSNLLLGKSVAIGCPKFDDTEEYQEKLTEIFKTNDIKSVTVAIMEVPCCSGMYYLVEEAIKKSGKDIPLKKKVVSISGELF